MVQAAIEGLMSGLNDTLPPSHSWPPAPEQQGGTTKKGAKGRPQRPFLLGRMADPLVGFATGAILNFILSLFTYLLSDEVWMRLGHYAPGHKHLSIVFWPGHVPFSFAFWCAASLLTRLAAEPLLGFKTFFWPFLLGAGLVSACYLTSVLGVLG